ncbi:ATP-dependent DNA helicase RRM3-like [Helianthus annuus]|uniref:ATP-dependent DNA helicase RRM3-like n=1 Tax=Helianthus annuus TaxID=4232 RepID=UPI000B902652|nr:ATP-dependent DNA helicase RRM3-like [Helianthus annuus]
MELEFKLPTVDHVDSFISAEIPNRNEDPELFILVKEYMIHGPCGNARLSSPCMVDMKCSKGFPKKFQDHTTLDSNGFPLYRRRNDGASVMKNKVDLGNRSVVPYNKKLLKRYQAHINVEWCNQAASIKYLFKYINKGPDRATIAVVHGDNQPEEQPQDEIKEYYDCRYISACEASWRIFANEVHYRRPSVMRLPFHLPGQQPVVFGPDEDINSVLNKPSVKSSMFLSWMERNKDPNDLLARTLTYVQFPIFLCMEARQASMGTKKREKINWQDSFRISVSRDACYALGLLDDDSEYVEAIKEANLTGSSSYIQNLFSTMLLSSSLSRPEVVWESSWRYMADDFVYRLAKYHRVTALSIPDHQLKNYVLCEIEKFLLRNNSSLRRFESMPYPNMSSSGISDCRLIYEEQSYDTTYLGNLYDSQLTMLTDEQRSVFEEIMAAVNSDNGRIFFLYGYGGTGKTFLWKTLSAAIRSRGQIVLNVASSGIASLLLDGGRTAHSRVSIPLNLTEDSVCNIKPESDPSKLLHETKLIIWDEAPMVHKHAFEALDRTMNDVFNIDTSLNSEIRFGGKVIVFGGDFRQILPVVPNGGRQEIVNASLCSSYLWSKCKLLRLTRNMRLTVGTSTADVDEINTFGKWILDLSEGNVGGPNDGEATIEIPQDLLITDASNPIASLIDFVYPSIFENVDAHNYFSDRAILAPKNDVVHEINDRLLAMFPGEEKEYLSSNSLCPSEDVNSTQQRLYSPDVLNGLKISGLLNHRLVLKVGVPVMLLRNIDQRNGLCNGTRLQVKKLHNRVIEAEIISGSNIGTCTYIPRLNLIPSDKKIPFAFQTRQFPLVVCFAMTINKSQGQSLSRVGLYLKQPVFSHGQLYVALSRVKTRNGVKILILDNNGKPTDKTTNVVYKEIFNEL